MLLICGVSAGAVAVPRAVASTAYDSASISDGALVAARECSVCHAIGKEGASPRPDAPVFRHILSRYHSETLEAELAQGIKVSHPMPEFQLNPKAVDDLIVYLKSIQQ
jgi:mono/diheme cytochrome c family protein